MTEELKVGDPYPCPNCGATNAWKADYYEAVWQGALLMIGDEGEPDLIDYDGVTGTYDDGASENECYRCRECDHTIELFKVVFVDVDETKSESTQKFIAGIKEDVGYHEDADQSVDYLIEYKNTLENCLADLISEKGLPSAWKPQPTTG